MTTSDVKPKTHRWKYFQCAKRSSWEIYLCVGVSDRIKELPIFDTEFISFVIDVSGKVVSWNGKPIQHPDEVPTLPDDSAKERPQAPYTLWRSPYTGYFSPAQSSNNYSNFINLVSKIVDQDRMIGVRDQTTWYVTNKYGERIEVVGILYNPLTGKDLPHGD